MGGYFRGLQVVLEAKMILWAYLFVVYHIRENVCGGNFCSFHSFSLNCKSFPASHGLVNQQYKSTTML